jgi:hypothetical protein
MGSGFRVECSKLRGAAKGGRGGRVQGQPEAAAAAMGGCVDEIRTMGVSIPLQAAVFDAAYQPPGLAGQRPGRAGGCRPTGGVAGREGDGPGDQGGAGRGAVFVGVETQCAPGLFVPGIA